MVNKQWFTTGKKVKFFLKLLECLKITEKNLQCIIAYSIETEHKNIIKFNKNIR